MTKTIAITGATGFVGGAMLRHFLARGWRVLAFGRRADFSPVDNVRYIQWDISSGIIDMDEAIDAVVHSAAYVHDWGAYQDFYAVNVTGTEHVLDSFPDVKHFIHISSSSVYDPLHPKHNIDETYPYAEKYLNHYGTTKMLAEKLILQRARPNTAILRPHAIYGEGDTTILPRLLKTKRGRFMFSVGDGTNRTNLTYVGNLCHAADLVTQAEIGCEVFNIVDAEPIAFADIFKLLIHYLELDAEVRYIPFSLAMSIARLSDWVYRTLKLDGQPTLTPYRLYNLINEYTIDISKARDMLGYDPPYNIEAGFQRVKHWLEHDGGWAVIWQAMNVT